MGRMIGSGGAYKKLARTSPNPCTELSHIGGGERANAEALKK
jgi:hypothetical protein